MATVQRLRRVPSDGRRKRRGQKAVIEARFVIPFDDVDFRFGRKAEIARVYGLITRLGLAV